MKTNFENQLEALNNATNRLDIDVHLVQNYDDKRTNPKFTFTKNGTSISGKMNYECANMFILGYMRGANIINH